MKYQQLCDGIIAKVGGRDNVLDVSHCITRLRFHLKDESLAQTDELKAMKGVVDVIQAGGQYQVVIGATVESVYNELVQIGGFDAKPALDIDEGDNVKKGDPFSRLLAIISEILQPVLGVLMDQVDARPLHGCRLARQGQQYLCDALGNRRFGLLLLPAYHRLDGCQEVRT